MFTKFALSTDMQPHKQKWYRMCDHKTYRFVCYLTIVAGCLCKISTYIYNIQYTYTYIYSYLYYKYNWQSNEYCIRSEIQENPFCSPSPSRQSSWSLRRIFRSGWVLGRYTTIVIVCGCARDSGHPFRATTQY